MRHNWFCIALLVASGFAVAQTTTTLYKTTDSDGKIVYSDRPSANAQEAKTLQFKTEPGSPLSAQTLAYIEQLTKSMDTRISAKPSTEVVLYSAAWCMFCKHAKSYLAAKQIAYREVDIGTQDGLLSFTRAGGKKAVPFLLVDGKAVSGFSAASYDRFLAQRK